MFVFFYEINEMWHQLRDASGYHASVLSDALKCDWNDLLRDFLGYL